MKKNVGQIDRLIRIILGLAVAAVGIIFDSWWGILGVVLIATGLFRICLLYLAFNISTNRKKTVAE